MWWRNWAVSILEFPSVWSWWILTFMVSSHMSPCLLSLQDLDLEAGSASGKIIRQEYIKGKAVYSSPGGPGLHNFSLVSFSATNDHDTEAFTYKAVLWRYSKSRGSLLKWFSPRDVYPWPETFLVHGWRDDAGTWWGEARYAAQHLWCPGRHPSYPAQCRTPRLRSPILI